MARKCRQCGLVNWEHDEVCKRCGASLNPATPAVYTWFVVYCILMGLLYLLLAVVGVAMMFTEPDADMSEAEAKVMSAVFIMLGLVFGAAYGFAPFLPRQSWVWTYGIVLICLGLTSSCCLPACIPLLIFWLKPEMKAFYGKNLSQLRPPPPPQWS